MVQLRLAVSTVPGVSVQLGSQATVTAGRMAQSQPKVHTGSDFRCRNVGRDGQFTTLLSTIYCLANEANDD